MKIDPKHDYRKPIYAVSLAALMTTGLVTGCINDTKDSGKIEVRTGHGKYADPVIEGTTDPNIEGGETVIVDPTDPIIDGGETVIEDPQIEGELPPEPELDGDVAVIDDGDETEIAGDVQVVDED